MKKQEYIKSQKECASFLGISLSQYNKELKSIKCPKFKSSSKNNKKNDLLISLGLSSKDLKKKVR